MREKWFLRKKYRPNLWVQGVFLMLIICAFTTLAAAAPADIPAAAATSAPIAPEIKAVAVDRQMLEETVNKALEHQLAPVKEMLTELTIHQTSLTDIIGGIGYILGLFGLAAYFLSKRKNNP
jgi:nickel transport protein